MNKQNYFRYFGQKDIFKYDKKTQTVVKQYEDDSLLPHITQEYNYRITNHLLMKKIINPKRDKIIMGSLYQVSKKNLSPKSFALSRNNSKSNFRTSMKSRKCKTTNTPHKNNRSYHISRSKLEQSLHLESQSIVVKPSKSQHMNLNETQQLNNFYKKQFTDKYSCKIVQNSIMDQFPTSLYPEKQVVINVSKNEVLNQKPIIPLYKNYFKSVYVRPISNGYGFGPSIILINHIQININPSIQDQTLVQIQLVQKIYKKKLNQQKIIKTKPIKFCHLPNHSKENSFIKFYVKLSQIGDFVPIRIYKYTGVEDILVGTFDLPLLIINEKQQNNLKVEQRVEWQTKKDSKLLGRRIFFSQVTGKLKKTKMCEADASIYIKYQVYSKKFHRNFNQ